MSDAPRVLVVCTANVCRSPTAALLLQQRLLARGTAVEVRLGTAGTDADPGARFCPVAADLLGADAVRVVEHHSSRLLGAPDLDDTDLVLVMERAHRAGVVALDPAAGLRTFTLREAAALGRVVGPPSGRDLPGLVRAMHAARGSASPASHPRPLADRLRRASHVDPLDVPDAHVRRSTTHSQVLSLLHGAVDAWVDAWVGPRPG